MKRCPKLTEKQKKELRLFVKSKGPTGTELKRAQTVLLLGKGETIENINFITGYHRRQIFELRKRYLAKGLEGLRSRRKTKRSLLTPPQLREITRIIGTKAPNELGLDYSSPFWTTTLLANFIKRIYGIRYKSKTSYYLLFKEARFTYHKPGRKYHKRNDKEVLKWRRKTRKKLQKAWKDPNMVILAEDELILSTQTTFQKVWLPVNKYPKVEISNTRKNRSVYGFLNLKTGKQVAYSTERQNMEETTKVLKRLRRSYPKNDNHGIKTKGKKLLILWDNAGWHRGSLVQEFIKKDGKIEVIYFPTYSPEENPQEHVWKEARSQVTHNRFIENIDKATKDFISYLNNTRFLYSLLGFGAKM